MLLLYTEIQYQILNHLNKFLRNVTYEKLENLQFSTF
ncbi:hypothetical protein SAMN05444408_107156 [Chryseobacterium takakiae]|jgi:hypothetical protein|uniref:Uncharacterized protein n=1 Tax=Chryseobacterium takakiae TaxID=1302685 RepID=A0A1M4Y6Z5_9FLAO|nr:hypothetical protein SAMN05444408_107156 [Chryseobacterium takakiae]